ncbi:hypothetical protein ACFL3F_03625 [Planctomycetota bacterium]
MSMKFYDDDGTEINADLIPKPDLCITCVKDGVSGKEEMLCTLTRADQQGESEFFCDGYESKSE